MVRMPAEEVKTKRCTGIASCGEIKPLSEFPRRWKSKPPSLQNANPHCRTCYRHQPDEPSRQPAARRIERLPSEERPAARAALKAGQEPMRARARARPRQGLLVPYPGRGTHTPSTRGEPVGNSGLTAEQLMHRLLERAGWRMEWFTRYQRYGFDAVCRRGREVLYLEIKSGGSIEMTNWEWEAAEKYRSAYRLVHVCGDHVRYYVDPAHDPMLRHAPVAKYLISGWRNAGTSDPAWLEPIRLAARRR